MCLDQLSEEEDRCNCTKAFCPKGQEAEWAFPELHASGDHKPRLNCIYVLRFGLLVINVVLSCYAALKPCLCLYRMRMSFSTSCWMSWWTSLKRRRKQSSLIQVLSHLPKKWWRMGQSMDWLMGITRHQLLPGCTRSFRYESALHLTDTLNVFSRYSVCLSSIVWVRVCCRLQGTLTNETRCLRCETITARDETFLDLSLDIEQNSSITSCLRNFSSTETLNAEDKFFCDKCCRWVCYSSSHFEVSGVIFSSTSSLIIF